LLSPIRLRLYHQQQGPHDRSGWPDKNGFGLQISEKIAILPNRGQAVWRVMGAEFRTALVAAVAAIVSAAISAAAAIYVSNQKINEVTNDLRRYIYDNGWMSTTKLAGGKMVIRLNGSRNAGPRSSPIDMERFTAMCGDEDGCQLTLGATRFRDQINKDYISDAPLQGAPCRFFYTRTKHWSLSQACVAIYGLYAWSEKAQKYEFNRVYQVYEYSNAYGIDDSFKDGTDPDGRALIILSFKGACYLAESAADDELKGGRFRADDPNDKSDGRGLFLVASSPTWDFAGAYPKDDQGVSRVWPADDSERQCILIVED
jgi:hypothetical protein